MTATKRAAVLGSPIAHSLSPALHRAAYRKLGLDWTYDAIDVPKDQFTRVLAELLTDPSLVGLSVTMPLKELALAAAQEATVIARQTQAANTLIVGANSLSADNTDPDGIIWALTRAGLAGRVSHAGIIGAGATARSAVAALTKLGAHTLYVVARRPEAIAELSKVAESFGARVVPRAWDAPEDVLAAPVVVSTVPGRAADDLAHAVGSQPGVLLDVVYAPWPTVLATAWRDNGGAVASGLEMLVGQAGRQVELMTGLQPPMEAMLAAGIAAQL